MAANSAKIAIVTGAASGIGRALSLTLARAGAQVYVADVNAAGLSALAQTITTAGGHCTPAVCDVTHALELAELAAMVRRDCGRIDVLINCAGLEINGEALAVDDTATGSDLEPGYV